ncbi:MAG: hypothetical protein KatS3mg068_0988 [Candidatus Sericytochromatia bacterium]|nr:MAG: hypothetical protein KatS3mg068_0988 [Candidatus Sericytochromatia bacterium]
MYPILLILHKLLMWAVIALFILNIFNFISKKSSNKEWDNKDTMLSKIFMIIFDIQITIGLVLYFLFSPITKTALLAGKEMMKNSELRFYTVEHIFTMLIAIAIAHVGLIKLKNKEKSVDKYKTGIIFFIISFILVLSRIPWNRIF